MSGQQGRLSTGALGARRRICYYTRSAEPSGMGRHMLELIAAFVDVCDVSILCRTSEGARWLFDSAAELGARTVPLPSPHDPIYPTVIADFLSSHRVDLFHGHAGWGWEDPDGFRIARGEGVRAIVLTHHLPFLLHSPIKARRLLAATNVVDRRIAVSDGLRRTYERIGVPHEQFTTVPNGVRARGASFGRLAARQALGLDADQPVVMTAGRLVTMKGHRHLVEATPQLVSRFPGLAVIILGRGNLHDQLVRQAADLGVGPAVRIVGHRPDARMLLDAADVFVLPSLTEGMPLAAMEAMDAALPVVATGVIGTDEVVVQNKTGLLVPPRDSGALADAVAQLLADRDLRTAYGQAGRARYLEEFTVEHMVARTAEVYRQELGRAPVTPAVATSPATEPLPVVAS
jgi:glycosyltransferase involved in cell wall biosynthesis